MLKNKYTLQVGLTTNNNQKKYSYGDGLKIINNVVSYYVSGATYTAAVGVWCGQIEKSIKIEIVSDLKIDFVIAAIINDLKIELMQDCILYEKNLIDIDFI